MNSHEFDFKGKRVLVTGGTGFVGGRLVERLILHHNAQVRVLVRNFGRALRIARYPSEIVYGDISKPEDVIRAADGCGIIIHCAYGNKGDDETRRFTNVEGTRNVLEAALRVRAERLVHLSTVAVYGWDTPEGNICETAPRRYSGDTYSDSKLDAEKIVLSYIMQHGLAATILQPTVIYGPQASPWTVNVLRWLKNERMILVNGGNGFCNAVYIDDLVNAILLAALKKEAVGEIFLISGEQPVIWKEFLGRYERMLGFNSTVEMSEKETLAYYAASGKARGIISEALSILSEEPRIYNRVRQTREINTLAKVARSVLPGKVQRKLKNRLNGNGKENGSGIKVGVKPIQPLSPLMTLFYASKATVSIEKAKRLLSYRPLFDFESGMNLTEQWARWANLV